MKQAILENLQWIFSGIGVLVITLIMNRIVVRRGRIRSRNAETKKIYLYLHDADDLSEPMQDASVILNLAPETVVKNTDKNGNVVFFYPPQLEGTVVAVGIKKQEYKLSDEMMKVKLVNEEKYTIPLHYLNDKEPINMGSDLGFKFNFPKPNQRLSGKIAVHGQHKFKNEEKIWILLDDGIGYYLQNPPIAFYNGKWEQLNIHLGGGIIRIHAVLVNDKAHKEFLKKVKNEEWGQFSLIPKGGKKIATIAIIN
ncbi:MAG: hypothetical protein MI922_10725 [Bacteroidales bacterium]|nr:hypothetical protein [Bacteroidales bacterium]